MHDDGKKSARASAWRKCRASCDARCAAACAGATGLASSWTDRPIGQYNTLREYQIQIDTMRGNCYCRHHAEQMLGGDS